MAVVKLRHKIGLITLGIFFTLVILEAGLRTAGAAYLFVQQLHNRGSGEGGEFRILCLGESTTALGGVNSYPSQMESILNQSLKGKKIKVINRGQVSKNSEDIYRHLQNDLARYKPDLVVTMIGVNDFEEEVDLNRWSWRIKEWGESFRVYKFLTLLREHLQQKGEELKTGRTGMDKAKALLAEEKNRAQADFKEEEYPGDPIESADEVEEVLKAIRSLEIKDQSLVNYLAKKVKDEKTKENVTEHLRLIRFQKSWMLVRLGAFHRIKGECQEAQKYLKMAVLVDPSVYGSYVELGRCLKEERQYPEAVILFKKAVELNPELSLGFLELGRSFNELGKYQEAYLFFRKVLSLQEKNAWVYVEVGRWFKEHGFYQLAEEAYSKTLTAGACDYNTYQQLAEIDTALGKKERADYYFKEAKKKEESLNHFAPPMTIRNYNKIVNTIRSKGIPLVSMQYPLREAGVLKEILNDRKDVTFVENKDNFREVLKGHEFSRYFSDNFAGDFGHCTQIGNRLIAENLAKVILEKKMIK